MYTLTYRTEFGIIDYRSNESNLIDALSDADANLKPLYQVTEYIDAEIN